MDIYEKLTHLIKNYEKVIIMTHKNPDLDGFSSSLCMYNIIEKLGRKPYIILGDSVKDVTIEKALKELKTNNLDYQLYCERAIRKMDLSNSLLIILDVHKKELTEYQGVLNLIRDIVIIDHHVKGTKYIKNTVLSYINSKASSTVEIMADYLKYLNQTVPPLVATLMLAGMDIDTNSFDFKTTENTFLAASHLMGLGANTILKQEILKENRIDYIRKQIFIKRSKMINDKMILCTLDENVYKKEFLAGLSDSLLQFDNIEASFTIGKVSKTLVGISARSIGNINVQSILAILGGGGHTTNAAVQLETTIEGAIKKLLDIIENNKEWEDENNIY